MENRIKSRPNPAVTTRLGNTFFITVLKEMFPHKKSECIN